MDSPARTTFEQCAILSGLLTADQLDSARSNVCWSIGDWPAPNLPPSDQELADKLVEMGTLNAWQAKQLLDGRTKFNLGPYLIIDSIGQGGMGQVFKARHEETGQIVAVKVLPLDKSTPEAIANFDREMLAMAKLKHPKLVAALDSGKDGNVHYMVTEYVPGADLRKMVRRDGLLEMSAAAAIISQVAQGLEYAHSQGIVHRDVKPGNVLVSPDGEAKLSDMGLFGPLHGEPEDDPRYGKIVGTADYLSPDHVSNPWNPTPAWDIYALGCTLYYAVTGKVPFPGGTTADKARAHCELRPLDPRRLNPQLRSEFVDLMADMMAKDPQRRISSAGEVVARLAPFLPGQPKSLVQPGASGHPAPPVVIGRSSGALMSSRNRPRLPPVPGVADTMPDVQDGWPIGADEDESNSVEVSTVYPYAEATGEALPMEGLLSHSKDPLKVLWPITVRILAPLALVGAVLLLLWLGLRLLLF